MYRSIMFSALALAACGQEAAPTPEASSTPAPAAVPVASGTASPTPVPAATQTEGSGIPEFGIPVALQGSWGLVAADCTSTRGDAKGLLRVSATTLMFYESVGRLGTIKDHGDKSIRANFGFSGEGMEWTREETLSVSGNTLTRTERGGDEPGAGGPFTYTKCTG